MFQGSAVALITPFTKDGIDYRALEQLIDFQANAGTECILVCGTTGESSTMSHEEHKEVIRFSAEYIRSSRGQNQFPLLMAGTGSNNTREALELTRAAHQYGADISLQITPYYIKPTQAGILHHFRTLAREIPIPQIIYNIKGRTGVNVEISTTVELAREPNIIGVKEASGDITQISDTVRLTPDDFYVWSGDDGLTLPILAVGGRGVISVTANIAPKEIRALVHSYLEGKIEKALEWHQKLADINSKLFIETNPIPVKTAANMLSRNSTYGIPDCGEFRSPMVPMSPKNEEILAAALRNFGFQF
ncbi:MAG: 4-hydroxy-tetrahydrodipicolinate synthase [bacterium]|jgi:4-hydroxy-tetrahydrodipicolinate synthase